MYCFLSLLEKYLVILVILSQTLSTSGMRRGDKKNGLVTLSLG
jgi:hypothetical protein